jgi:hypothetical protein
VSDTLLHPHVFDVLVLGLRVTIPFARHFILFLNNLRI